MKCWLCAVMAIAATIANLKADDGELVLHCLEKMISKPRLLELDHPEDPAFNHVPTKHSPEMTERMRVLPEGKSLYKGYSDAWKRCPRNEASCTIKGNCGGVNVHPKLPRVLTAREMARLQSFPDDFIFEGKKAKQLVQIGNAVPPFLGKAVGLAIRAVHGDLKG